MVTTRKRGTHECWLVKLFEPVISSIKKISDMPFLRSPCTMKYTIVNMACFSSVRPQGFILSPLKFVTIDNYNFMYC